MIKLLEPKEIEDIIPKFSEKTIHVKIIINDYFLKYDRGFTKNRLNFLLYSNDGFFSDIEKKGDDFILHVNPSHVLSISDPRSNDKGIYNIIEKDDLRFSTKCASLVRSIFKSEDGTMNVLSTFNVEIIAISRSCFKEERCFYEKKESIIFNDFKFRT